MLILFVTNDSNWNSWPEKKNCRAWYQAARLLTSDIRDFLSRDLQCPTVIYCPRATWVSFLYITYDLEINKSFFQFSKQTSLKEIFNPAKSYTCYDTSSSLAASFFTIFLLNKTHALLTLSFLTQIYEIKESNFSEKGSSKKFNKI